MLRTFVANCGIPVVGYETPMVRLVNPELLSDEQAKRYIDFVVEDAGSRTAYDQTIIHCSRSDNLCAELLSSSNRKIDSYSESLRRSGVEFVPLVMTSLGYYGPELESFVKMFKRIAKENGRFVNFKWFYSSLSCTLASFAGSYMARPCLGLKA